MDSRSGALVVMEMVATMVLACMVYSWDLGGEEALELVGVVECQLL